jgi:SAM-dependent methyltransferase
MRHLVGRLARRLLGRDFVNGLRTATETFHKYRGIHPRKCPICGYAGHFKAFGDPPRWDAMCPQCGGLERHRLLKLALDRNPGLVRGTVVHFAPEPAVKQILTNLATDYRSADLFNPADLKLDLEAIDLPSASIDVFVASHVLEHVGDDGKALAELRRCLRPGGAVIVMVPVIEGWRNTYEDPSISTDAGRDLHFGQWDHVRRYGADVRDRLRGAGFELSEIVASGDQCVRYGINPGETVFVATKP